MKKHVIVALLVTLCVCLSGCSLFDIPEQISKPNIESISLNHTAKTVTVGDTVDLSATFSPSDATAPTITWTSSNDVCATVDKNGKVSTLEVGEAIITATTKVGKLTASCTITIIEFAESLITRVTQPTNVSYDIPQPSLPYANIQNTLLTKDGETYSYTYYVRETGYYLLTSNYGANIVVAEDNSGEIIADSYISTTAMELTLSKQTAYRITVKKGSSNGNYEFKLFAPNPTLDISGKTIIKDNMRFGNQQAIYLYTTTVAGLFMLETSMSVSCKIYDDYDNLVESFFSSTTFAIQLEAFKTYKIKLTQIINLGDYTLKINQPNQINDVSNIRKVFDEMRFASQENVYGFVPKTTQTYNIKSSLKLTFRVNDEFGNSVYSHFGADTNFEVELIANKTYSFKFIQANEMGNYHFVISPKTI